MATTGDKSTRNIPEYRQIKPHTHMCIVYTYTYARSRARIPTGNYAPKKFSLRPIYAAGACSSAKERLAARKSSSLSLRRVSPSHPSLSLSVCFSLSRFPLSLLPSHVPPSDSSSYGPCCSQALCLSTVRTSTFSSLSPFMRFVPSPFLSCSLLQFPSTLR